MSTSYCTFSIRTCVCCIRLSKNFKVLANYNRFIAEFGTLGFPSCPYCTERLENRLIHNAHVDFWETIKTIPNKLLTMQVLVLQILMFSRIIWIRSIVHYVSVQHHRVSVLIHKHIFYLFTPATERRVSYV